MAWVSAEDTWDEEIMSWAGWRAFEKECADYFGGIRRVRVNYGESIGDIIHPLYSIEVKYGLQCPKKRKGSKFLDNAFSQARGYDPTKVPIVCLKRPRQQGFTIVTLEDCIYRFRDSGDSLTSTEGISHLMLPKEWTGTS